MRCLIRVAGKLQEFSWEVLLKVTHNFSMEFKIGHCTFGSVYHATLDDGRHVAIKRHEISSLSPSDTDRDDEFLNEIQFLSLLNHKNLVTLLGYCRNGSERVLVYDYMENGTLFDHLHNLDSSPFMSWPNRIKVALEVARGIEYLHEYAVPRVVHRDIKSSSILLDAMCTPKVADFGISLTGPQGEKSYILVAAAGSAGYVDPEYYRTNMFTCKSDVYSFGVVLLELLSGCEAVHEDEDGVQRNLVDHVFSHIRRNELDRVLDPRVPPPTPVEAEGVAYIGSLANDCVLPKGQDRPTMSDVVNSLEKALVACYET